MKKTTVLLLVSILSLSILAGCGAKRVEMSASVGKSSVTGRPEIAEEDGSYMNDFAAMPGEAEPAAAPSMAPPQGESGGGNSAAADDVLMQISAQGGNGMAEKIIYSVYAELETIGFDETVDKVYRLLDRYGAFIENSYIGGRNYAQTYYGYQSYRTARFVLRVPKDRLGEVTGGLSELGNVTSLQSDAQNITSQFFDTESRLKTYRTEEERLLAMLAKADTVTDMITIETRLSEVRYNIESLTSTLGNWQNQIDYSTVTLYVQEVEKLSETVPVQRSYWQQISDGIKSTLRGIGQFFMDVFKWLVVESPVLIIAAVIISAVTVIVRKKVKKVKPAKQNNEEDNQQTP